MNYGRYQVIKELGGGAMGVVYLAHDPHIGRDVALKVLRPERVTSKAFIERFRREAKAIGHLSHPNIVMVHDVGEDHGTIFIIMEFVEGKALSELIDEKRLSQDEIVDLAIQVAEALNYAHQRGIVHRDIKPSNIIVQPGGQAKITDFGIARLEDPLLTLAEHTRTGELLGTPAYMSPEQALGEEVDGRTDIFSLGVILYELVAGRRPFSGKSLASILAAIIEKDPPEPVTFNPDLPPKFSRIIKKCLSKSRDNRYQAGQELAEALRGLTRKEPAKAVSPPVSEKKRKWPLLLPASLLVVVAVGIILWVFPPKVSIMVKSNPEGAKVYVNKDENSKGDTPFLLKLKQQEAPRIRIDKKGYRPREKKIPVLHFIYMKLMTLLETDRIETLDVTLLAILTIRSDPSGAKVYIGQDCKGKTSDTPLEIELPPGTHRLQVRMKGYHPWEKEISLAGDRIEPLEITLEPILTTLHIKSTPSKADVYVGSEETPRGRTPINLKLPSGIYKIRVKKKNYQPWNEEIRLEKSGIPPISAALEPILGTLHIKSMPSKADVYVGSEENPRGKTPIDLELPLGAHKVRVTMKGYHPHEDLYELRKKRPPPLNLILIPEKVVYLKVESKPSGAEVYLGEDLRGQTPIKVKVPPTEHRLRLIKQPYEEWKGIINLSDLKENWFEVFVDLKTGEPRIRYKEKEQSYRGRILEE